MAEKKKNVAREETPAFIVHGSLEEYKKSKASRKKK